MNFKVIFPLSILLSFNTVAQKPNLPIDSITKKITYTQVVYVDSSLNSQELFSIGKEWFAKSFNSSNDVIQMADKESGKIVGKGTMQVYCKSIGSHRKCGFVNFTISIYLKNARYKYEITNFIHTGQTISRDNVIPDYGPCEYWINDKREYPLMSQNGVQKISNYFLKQLDDDIKALTDDLKKVMSNTKKENW